MVFCNWLLSLSIMFLWFIYSVVLHYFLWPNITLYEYIVFLIHSPVNGHLVYFTLVIAKVIYNRINRMSKAGRQRPWKANGAHTFQRQSAREISLAQRGQFLFSWGLQLIWWGLQHYEGQSAYSKLTDLNGNLIQNYFLI